MIGRFLKVLSVDLIQKIIDYYEEINSYDNILGM